jgi:hypothetical protein
MRPRAWLSPISCGCSCGSCPGIVSILAGRILSFFIIIGFVWWIIDAFLIPGMIREKQNEIRGRLTAQMAGSRG